MEIHQQQQSNVIVLGPVGRLDSLSCREFEARLLSELEQSGSVVVDCTALDYISSAGLRALLVAAKRKVGRALNSAPILADANCTMVCLYMSLVLLAASLIYELTGFGFVDSLGALGLIYFSVNEGREAFEKARGLECACEQEGE